MSYTNIKACRLCKSPYITKVIEFGEVPLANSYPETADKVEELFPLTLMKCDACGHVQLRETVSPTKLFSNYLYSSSDSPALVSHFRAYAAETLGRIKTDDYTQILEIGCNDGVLLKEFEAYGIIHTVGVEPASNIADKAKAACSGKIYNCFFNEETAQHLKETHGPFDIITANNVFAHVAELDSLTKGIALLLSDDGFFVFENAYLLDTIGNLYFDQIYHEHLQYYGIKPLIAYFKKFGLEIFDIGYVGTQGGSFRIYVKREGNPKFEVREQVSLAVKAEEQFGLYELESFNRFKADINNLQENFETFMTSQIDKTFSCYGCPAKFALFSKVLGLNQHNIKYVVDDSPLKQGRFSPGAKIPIVSGQHFRDNPTDYSIVSVWNMAQAVMSRNSDYKGNFVLPFPELRIVHGC